MKINFPMDKFGWYSAMDAWTHCPVAIMDFSRICNNGIFVNGDPKRKDSASFTGAAQQKWMICSNTDLPVFYQPAMELPQPGNDEHDDSCRSEVDGASKSQNKKEK
jgi:hypothetical protein